MRLSGDFNRYGIRWLFLRVKLIPSQKAVGLGILLNTIRISLGATLALPPHHQLKSYKAQLRFNIEIQI